MSTRHTQFKSIIIALTIIFCAFFATSSLYSQPPQQPRPPMPPDSSRIVQMVDELANTLSLSGEQKGQVAKMHFAHFKEAGQLMKKHKETRDKERQAMDSLRKEFEEQLKALFTDEQKTEFEKFMKNRGPRPGQQKPRR